MITEDLTPDPSITEEQVAAFAGEPVHAPPRKRARPRKDAITPAAAAPAETPGIPTDEPIPPREEPEKPATKREKGEPGFAPPPAQAYRIDCEMIGFGCAAVFGVIATVTRHDHWLRTPDQCRPISEPVARMIARMPAKQRKALTQTMDPAILLAGVYQVAGPSIEEEARLLQMRRAGLVAPARAAGSDPVAPHPPGVSPGGDDPGKISLLQGTMIGETVIQ
jgi:hypothetical protein